MGQFDSFFDRRDARQGQLTALQLSASPRTPEQAAEQLVVSQELGVPAPLVGTAPDHFKRQAAQLKMSTTLQRAPKTAQWLTQPDNGDLASDDLDNLSWFETALSYANPAPAIGSAIGRAVAGDTAPGRAVRRGMRSLGAAPAAGNIELAQQLEADFGKTLDQLEAEELERARAQRVVNTDQPLSPQIEQLARAEANRRFNAVQLTQDQLDEELGTLRGDAVDRLLSVGSARTDLPMSPAAQRFEQELQNQKATSGGSILDVVRALGRDPLGGAAFLSEMVLEGAPQIAGGAALGVATRSPGVAAGIMGAGSGAQEMINEVSGFLEKSGVDVQSADALMDVIDNDELLDEALDRGYTRGAIIGVVEALSSRISGAAFLSGSAPRAAAAVAADAGLAAGGEAAAGLATDGKVHWSAVGVEMVAEGLMSGPIEGASVAAAGYAKRRAQAEMRAQETELLDGLDQMAASSKLRQRAPGKFKEALDAQGLNEQYLHVPADDINELFQGEVDDATLAGLGVTRQQYETAAASGADVAIPLSSYAANFQGKPEGARLRELGTLDPDGISAAREAAVLADAEDTFRQAVADVETAAAEGRQLADVDVQVRDQIAAQLTSAGRSPAAAQQEALVWSSFFRSMSERYGRPVEDTVQKFGVRIQGPQGLDALRQEGPAVGVRSEGESPASVAGDTAADVPLEQGPGFQQWFLDSAVVDEQGAPLRVFHSTRSDFDAFLPLSHFGTAKAADDRALGRRPEYDEKTSVVPVYLSIQRPLDMGIESDADGNSWNTVADMLHQIAGKLDLVGQGEQSSIVREVAYELEDREAETTSEDIRELLDEAREAIEDAGFDGLSYKNAIEDAGQRSYVALRPEQVKSVFNRGTFDFDDDRLLYQRVDERRDVPTEGAATGVSLVNSLASANAMARDETFPNMRVLKKRLQARAADGDDLTGLDDETAAKLADYVFEDALEAVQDNANAVGWYDRAVTDAKAALAEIYPEIAEGAEGEFAFIWALAVTSNGLKVDANFRLAAKAYDHFRETGTFPKKVGAGTAAVQIDAGLAYYQKIVEHFGGWEGARDFMVGEHTAKEIAEVMGRLPSGELRGAKLRGASILGAKIGNGFFSNLYGNFDALTMDRWLMRTVGRWRGTLIDVDKTAVASKRKQIRETVEALTAAETRQLSAFIGAPLSKLTGPKVDALAVSIQKQSMVPAWREEVNALPGGSDMRKMGNRLAQLIDGQVEAPKGGKEREFLRGVFGQALERLREQPGMEALTMADLQALLWYPEKLLYETARMPEGQEVRSYEDDEAPDYANAARQLVRERRGRSEPGAAGGRSADAEGGRSMAQSSVADAGRGGYSSGPLEPLEGAPRVEGASGPDQNLVAVAEAYAAANGIQLRRQSEFAEIDPDRARRIAEAYEAMGHAPNDPEVQAAYADLAAQTRAQYEALAEAGYEFWLFDDATDPYEGKPWNAMRDLRANKKMAVYATEAGFGTSEDFDPTGNPLMEDTGLRWPYGAPDGDLRPVYFNDLFRAVHDAFGHGIEGAGFRARGEENAWQAHVRLFHGPAVAALTSETRGQNSWLNYGPHGEHNRTAGIEETIFADQKTGLLPSWTWEEGRAGDEPTVLLQSAVQDGVADQIAAGPEQFFKSGSWFIMSAGARTDELKADIEQNGLRWIEVKGVYKGEDDGTALVAYDPNPSMLRSPIGLAMGLGQKYDQESVLTRRGLEYTDGSGRDAVRWDGIETGDAARAGDFYSVIDENDFSFSMNLQFPEPAPSSLGVTDTSYYGVPLEEDGRLRLTHWSSKKRDTLDPAKHGTGPLVGQERRGQGAVGTYYGLNIGSTAGYQKENLGNFKHEVLVDPARLYPWNEDPDGIVATLPAQAQRAGGMVLAVAYERAIKAAGHLGYMMSSGPQGQTAKVFEPLTPDSVTEERTLYQPAWNPDAAPQPAPTALEQRPGGGDARGSIELPGGGVANGETVINLFEGADLSTFLHESGHFFLEVFTELAGDPDAPQAMKDDLTTLRKHLNSEGGAWTTEQHELWARSFEGYLMEGKAPSLELQDAFARFKSWLTRIYRTVRGLGNVRLNPEVRQVMDRLLATEDQIAAAQADLNRGPLFADRPNGMSEADWNTYQRMARRATDSAERRLLERAMAKVRAARTAEYRDERKALRDSVADEVNSRPVYRLIEALANGRWLGSDDPVDDLRVDTDQLVDMFGDDITTELSREWVGGRRTIYTEGGLSPVEVARMFGFKSATEMVDALRNAGRRQEVIAAEVDRRLSAQFGDDFLNDETIEQAAVDALHADEATGAQIVELRHLAARSGRSTAGITRKAYQLRVRRMLGDMDVKTATQSERYLRAERRAAKMAQAAFAKVARGGGEAELAEAFQAKEQQVLAQSLYDESRKIAKRVERGRAQMRSYDKKSVRAKLEGGYIEQIDALLERYDFRRRAPGQIKKAESLQAFVQQMVAAGRERELNIDERLLRDANARHYSTLSVDQLYGVFDTVANIDHLGRLKQKLIEAKRTRDLNASAKRVANQIRSTQKPVDRKKEAGFGFKFLNTLRRPDTVLAKFDGGAELGDTYDELKRSIDEGAALEEQMQRGMADSIHELFSAHYDKKAIAALQKKRSIPGVTRREWTKEEILAVALNTGNKDNFQRLTADDVDPEYRIDEGTLEKLLDQLTDDDWRFVQGMWDLIDGYWPQLSEVHRRRTGVPPKKVQPQLMVQGKAGATGGYYPIKYDPRLGHKEVVDEESKLWDVANGWGATVQVANGMTVQRKRAGGGRTLQLDLRVPTAHMRDTIRYVAMSEAVDATNRILNHPAVTEAMQQTGHSDTRQVLKLWLEDMAAGPIRSNDVVSSTSRMVKNNFTLSRLAFNLKTIFLQTTGLGQSAVVIGKRAMFDGLQAYLRSPRAAMLEVTAASSFMRERQTTFQKDIYDLLDESAEIGPTQSRYRKAKTGFAKLGFWPIVKTQFVAVDMPTWLGAYRAEMERGDNHDAAVHFADRMVARAQDSGLLSDRAGFERGTVSQSTRQSDFLRLFTTLGGYMLTKANRAEVLGVQTVAGWQQARSPAQKAAVALNTAADLFLLFAFEAMIMGLLAEIAFEDDDEDLSVPAFMLREAIKAPFAAVPFVRDAVSAFSGYGGGGIYGSVSEVPARLYTQLEQMEFDAGLLKASGDAIGVLTGLPSTAAARAMAPLLEEEDTPPAEFLLGRNPLAR